MSTFGPSGSSRISTWLARWGPLLPVLSAELIVMLGFGALLPVLPLFIEEQGIDAAALGVIVAGWPIAKLIAEPVAGWWADRHDRRPQMVLGLVAIGLSSVAMLAFTSVLALFVLRLISGAAAGMYDAAARGTIVDATDSDERGEAFGFYGAFQMGGFVVGPAAGAFGSAIVGGFVFPFVLTGVLGVVAAGVLVLFLSDDPHVTEDRRFGHRPEVEPPRSELPFAVPTVPVVAPEDPPAAQAPLRAIANRMIATAVVIGFGVQLSFGVYEVVWSIYLVDLGASIEWVGLTFVLFALPSMVISPIAGRLVDRRGPMPFIVVGSLVVIVAGILYSVASEPIMPSIVVPLEATATAVLATALFTLVALGSPPGRSSTAQGVYGASGTIALVIASIAAGALWERDTAWPFWFFVAGLAICLAIGLVITYGWHGRGSPSSLRGALR